jgi:hypothetical protein
MKLNSTKVREVQKDLLSFYTNAIAYLTKWFNFSDENYLKMHILLYFENNIHILVIKFIF